MNSQRESLPTRSLVLPTRTWPGLSPRILVVEDNIPLRELSACVLARSGYQVDTAEDGAMGWGLLHAGSFDLLITDHEMPRMSGLELVEKARAARMALPIIMATGTLPEEELQRRPWLQLSGTLLKPFTPGQLLDTVKRVLCAAMPVQDGPPSQTEAPGRLVPSL